MVSLLLMLLLGLCNAQEGKGDVADNEILVDELDKEDVTTTILRMNNGSRDFMLEGDMLIPKTRTAMKCLRQSQSCQWPKSANGKVEVPFTLSSKYDNAERKILSNAMKDYERETCIRFVPRRSQRGYLSIEPRYGCASLLGFTGSKQVVSLQRYGCISHGIIQHELLHALGFYHEHTRSDRDQYVRINWENVNEYFVKNFQKMDTNNLNTPYDYSSIMHYARNSFGILRKETITPIPDSSVSIGEAKRLSKIDILRINRFYKCR